MPVGTEAPAVYRAAQAGDPQAQALLAYSSALLGRALQWLVMTYDVEKIVLGGGVTGAGAAFLNPVYEALAQLRLQSALAASMLPDAKIVLLPAEYNAGLWGALRLAGVEASGVRGWGRLFQEVH